MTDHETPPAGETDPTGTPETDIDQIRVSQLGEGWATIDQASTALGISPKTVRRRLQAGELAGRKALDPDIGGERWMVSPEALPRPEAQMIPVEVLDRLRDAYQLVTEATARAEVAERTIDFERERRAEIEAERDRLRARLDKKWWKR